MSVRTARRLFWATGMVACWVLGSPALVSAGTPEKSATDQVTEESASQGKPQAATEVDVEAPPTRAPLCTGTKLRLVGAIAASVNSFALVRSPAGTALLSPGERLNGHELLIVGAHQALMRAPTGDPCRLLLYHRSDADKVKSRSSRRAKARRARKRRKQRRRRNKR